MTRPRGVFVGLATVDLIHRVDRPAGVDEKVTALSQEIVAGGPAANAAVTFALLGGNPELITDLGRHPLAVLARQDLAASGVTVRAVEPDKDVPPAVSSIRILDRTGDRSVVSVNAAARTVDPPPWLRGVLDGAAVLLLDGHHPRLALAAARAARDRDVPVVLDAGSWKPVLDELLPLVDVAVCSAAFRVPGAGATGAPPGTAVTTVPADLIDPPDPMGPPDRQDPPDPRGRPVPADPSYPAGTAARLLARGVSQVAISRGGAPLLWWAGRRSGAVPVPSVEVRDTLGAGDVLHGAFAWAVATGPDDLAGRLAGAAAVASQRCAVVGTGSWRRHLAGRG